MTEPGWYVDYENPKQMRYHDGAAWTAHVHSDRKDLPTAPVEPAVAVAQAERDTSYSNEPKQDPAWLRAIMYPLLGLFAGLIVGGSLFNAVGAITPVTEVEGTVRNIEIDYNQGSSSSSRNRRSYVISGTTADGQDWQIVNDTAYNVLQAEGYPQPVTVAMGDWTGTAERVTGASFEVDHQSTGARIGWGAALVVVALIAAAVPWAIARNKNGGVVAAVTFAVFMIGPGSWLGFQAFQWIQSG